MAGPEADLGNIPVPDSVLTSLEGGVWHKAPSRGAACDCLPLLSARLSVTLPRSLTPLLEPDVGPRCSKQQHRVHF